MTTARRREASAFAKLRLLMWKNFLQQWRHRWQTLIGILIPVFIMLVILIVRGLIPPEPQNSRVYEQIEADTLGYSWSVIESMDSSRLAIAYSPESPVLEEVIKSSLVTILRHNVRILDSIFWREVPELEDLILSVDWNQTLAEEIIDNYINIEAYDNSGELNGVYREVERTRSVITAIEFEDSLLGTTELPADIKYAVRFPERRRRSSFSQQSQSWRTDMLFPVLETSGPREPFNPSNSDPGYTYEMFLAFQNTISMELVSRLTNVDLRQHSIVFQRFSYPRHINYLMEFFVYLLPALLLVSYSFTTVTLVKAVVTEKELQLKEYMKIMGLPTWLHWTAWFCKQFIFLFIVTILIATLLKIPWFSSEELEERFAVLPNTPWTVLVFFLGIYSACIIFFCFMLSGFFSKASVASVSTGLIWFLVYAPSFLILSETNHSPVVQGLACLSLNSALSYGFAHLISAESSGGMRWGQFMAAPSTDANFLFGHVIIMLVVDCILYMLIALYFEQVLPGTYGVPRPWYFPFQPSFWCPDANRRGNKVTTSPNTSQVVKENDPVNCTVGVQISKLTKAFGKNVAVNELTLNVYDDQITALLGHNGAGKSTAISMLTGYLKATYGTVIIGGYDLTTQLSSARTLLGLCPQHNIIFNELTVQEHIEFFSRLKGYTGTELKEEIDMLINKLELQDKRNYQAGGLSGGQKRRLVVGVALCGGTQVVLLDEPSSGMDPSSRRALWELLQKEKKGRSIVLTTHFMDEADVLGDRVAIMAQGQLQCIGSPYFLKRHYGVGYTLVVIKDHGFDADKCTQLIRNYIPDANIKEDRGSEITYSLLNEYSHTFEALFCDLEAKTDQIGFRNYGLTATTLEDVFMRVGSGGSGVETTTSISESNVTASSETLYNGFHETPGENTSQEYLDPKDDAVTGIRLLWQQVLAVWLKLFLIWKRSPWLVLTQILVPLCLMALILGMLNFSPTGTQQLFRLELELTDRFTSTETLLEHDELLGAEGLGARAAEAYAEAFDNVGTKTLQRVYNESPGDYYLRQGEDRRVMARMRHRNLIGATFNDTAAVAWFSNFGYHDMPISLAAVHTALLRAYRPDAKITVFNHPLEATYEDVNRQTPMYLLAAMITIGMACSVGLVSAVFVMFYIKERMLRAKLLQKASGIQPAVLWGSAAVFDWLWFAIIALSFVIVCGAFRVTGLSSATELALMYLLLVVYGAAMLPLNYIFSYFFDKPATGFSALFFLNMVFGLMGPLVVSILRAHDARIMEGFFQIYPLYSLIYGVRNLNSIGIEVQRCMELCDFYFSVFTTSECTMEALCETVSSCCMSEDPYFRWAAPGFGKYLTIMIISGAVLWAILMIFEYRLPQKVFRMERKPPFLHSSNEDADVLDEAHHAESVGQTSLRNHNLVAKKLTRYYGKNLAVNQISFTVGDDECFGLLGVNGAGKTSTFKMLMGDESISSGDAYVQGHSVKTDIRKVHEHIGYCPQFDAIFEELTGRETLQLFGLLRGFRREIITAKALVLAEKLGFLEHLDKKVYQYSGGNKRKLSTAVALLGSTRLVFLDEPTTGVDPAAKRQVWQAIRKVTRAGRGVVLTSHSMEECEALCSRLTIMVNGRFHCLGTPQHLKNKFSQGFTLTIKIKIDECKPKDEQMKAAENFVTSNFPESNLMEEYQGLLTYYLSDTGMAWSHMFAIMERARTYCNIEDYTIAQTTLEQIFLQFTKYQNQMPVKSTTLL